MVVASNTWYPHAAYPSRQHTMSHVLSGWLPDGDNPHCPLKKQCDCTSLQEEKTTDAMLQAQLPEKHFWRAKD